MPNQNRRSSQVDGSSISIAAPVGAFFRPKRALAVDELEYTQAMAAGAYLKTAIESADSVAVGIGSGMSAASGYNFYSNDLLDSPGLAPYQMKYHFRSLFDGFYHPFSCLEDEWGFLSAAISMLRNLPVGDPYRDLAKLLENKHYFVLTTNVDGQVQRAFPKNQVCLFQGSFDLLQCKQPCCDRLWEAQDVLDAAAEQSPSPRGAGTALTMTVPRCPECGWTMRPWVRDDTFLEGNEWKGQVERYEAFLKECLIDHPERKVLFLELGVGEMTPSIITLPFWDMVGRNENASLLSVNLFHGSTPGHLGKRATTLAGDLRPILHLASEL